MLTLQVRKRAAVLVAVVTLGFAGLSVAQETVGPITFDEPEFPLFTPVQGLTINTLNGVPLPAPLSFDFPNPDATITGGPGTQQFVDPPGIEGPSDTTLSIDFGAPVDFVEFGFAVICPPVVIDALTVDLFDSAGTLIDTQTFDGINTGFPFAENQVTLQGMVFQSIQATWPFCFGNGIASQWGDGEGQGNGSRFLLDNLTYTTSAVPTIGLTGLLLLALVLLGGSIWLLRKRQATT